MTPPVPGVLLRVMPTLIMTTAIANIILGFASKREVSDIHKTSGASMAIVTNVSFGVWTLSCLIYVGVARTYTPFKPCCIITNLATVPLMTTMFTYCFCFDPFDWPIWGPFATVLGVVFGSGLDAAYHDTDSQLSGELWKKSAASNNDAGTGYGLSGSSDCSASRTLALVQNYCPTG